MKNYADILESYLIPAEESLKDTNPIVIIASILGLASAVGIGYGINKEIKSVKNSSKNREALNDFLNKEYNIDLQKATKAERFECRKKIANDIISDIQKVCNKLNKNKNYKEILKKNIEVSENQKEDFMKKLDSSSLNFKYCEESPKENNDRYLTFSFTINEKDSIPFEVEKYTLKNIIRGIKEKYNILVVENKLYFELNDDDTYATTYISI